jgi:hypothetical protein
MSLGKRTEALYSVVAVEAAENRPTNSSLGSAWLPHIILHAAVFYKRTLTCIDTMTVAEVAQNETEVLDRGISKMDVDADSPTVSDGQDAKMYTLKAVVKDTRVQPALHAAYCHVKTSCPCSNLLLVLTSNTLTIYDDFHMGEHVAIVAQYVHEDEEEKSTMVSAAWIPGAVDSEVHSGSPRILLALSNGNLAVVDIVESKVTQMFNMGGAFDASGYVLLAAPEAWVDGKEHVCVLGGNAVASVWNVAKEEKVASIEKAVSAVAYVDGTLVAAYGLSAGGGVGMHDVDGKELDGSHQFDVLDGKEIDSILRIDEGTCLLRDEREFRLWDMKEGAVTSTFKVKGKRDQSEVAFDANGSIAVLGTDDGDGHVFDVHSGEEICDISVVRVSSEVEAVAVSGDGRHIILAAGSGFLFRFLKA